MQQQHDALEALFLADARAAARVTPQEPIRPVIAPAVAAQAAWLRRRRKQRRERLLMAAIALPMLVLLVMAAIAWLRGEHALLQLLLIPAGICGFLALVTLPLIEKFRPQQTQYHGHTGAMPAR